MSTALAAVVAVVWVYALVRAYGFPEPRWHRIAAACACTCPEPYLPLTARAATPSCVRCRGVIRV